MKLTYSISIALLFIFSNCKNDGEKVDDYIPTEFSDAPEAEGELAEEVVPVPELTILQNPNDFIPAGFVEYEKTFADLNKDGLEDCILIFQDTKKENFVQDEYKGKLNRNRRGLIIALKTDNGYQLINRNINCFASAEEDGGTYFYPELSVYSEKGLLYIHYSHGQYGYWKYTFRYQNDNFELIGYDKSSGNMGIEMNSVSYNFSTNKKLERTNKYLDDPEKYAEMDKFNETWTNLPNTSLYKISEIEDFETFDERFDE